MIQDMILTFVLLYILAIIVERFIELCSESNILCPDTNEAKSKEGKGVIEKFRTKLQVLCLFHNKAKIDEEMRVIANRQKLINGITSLSKGLPTDENMEKVKRKIEALEEEILTHENVKRKQGRNRILILWSIGLIFSLIICYIINIKFDIKIMQNIVPELNSVQDCFLSALFISGGTKPLHDILLALEKFKKPK